MKAEEINPDIITVTIAHDGIALVVHKDNPVANLTKEQVEKIYHAILPTGRKSVALT